MVFQDEPLHWRQLALLPAVEERRAYLKSVFLAGEAHADVDFVVQKHQAKWLWDERVVPQIQEILQQRPRWYEDVQNIFLIRCPGEMIRSHHRALTRTEDIPMSLTFEQVGIRQLSRLFSEAITNSGGGSNVVVVDSNTLLLQPRKNMKMLCSRIDIPFSESMIDWGSVEITAPLWGKHWYEAVASSGGLQTYVPSDAEESGAELLSPALFDLVKECRPYYDKLQEHAMKFEEPHVRHDDRAAGGC